MGSSRPIPPSEQNRGTGLGSHYGQSRSQSKDTTRSEAADDALGSSATDSASRTRKKAGDAAETANHAVKSTLARVETYIRENPIPAAIGVASAAALIAIAIKARGWREPSLQRKVMRELGRYSEDIRNTVQGELRNLNVSGNLNAIAKMLPEEEVKRLIAPWIDQFAKAFSEAKSKVAAATDAKISS